MDDLERQKKAEDLGKDLKTIYSDKEGKLPDFTRLDGKPGSRLKSAILGTIAALAILGGITWAGLLFFSRSSGFTGENVELAVETAESFTTGAENDVVIRYRNHERIPLARAEIEFRAPEGFEIVGSDPAAAEEGSWSVGSVAPGAEGEVKIRGYVRKELDAAMTFTAKLNYRPADFNADFQKVASHTVVVSDSALALTGAGPKEMTPGDEIAFTYEYENRSEQALEGLRFVIDPLEGFIFASAEPKPDEDVAMQWTVPKLEPKTKGAITVKGTFSAASRGPKALAARMGFVGDAGLVTIARAEAVTEVQKSNLDLSLIVNGSDKPPTVSFGDQLFFTIRYENAGDVALKDVTLDADLPSDPKNAVLDWPSLKDDLAGVRKDTTITWTKKELPALESLAPGDKGEINFSVQIVRKPLEEGGTSDYVIHAAAGAKIAKVGKTSGAREVAAVPMDIHLLSDASFTAYGRYYSTDGVPLGSGPLPPKVGEKTVYRVYWIVRNSLHELTNLSASTLLPQGVKWTGVPREVGAGSLDFDETGRKATWRLNRMPTSVPEVVVSFEVELTPEAEDIGEIMDLTGDNRFEAYDKSVEAVILKTQPPIGTDLIGDEDASGKGVVTD
ncbi:MAG TPA: hypothetical protein VL283_04055 [Candidatus Baltobacteraceae bacterium]|nr:hypothetical protein [Candidatus Baltobacteraceae bacterium]